MKDFHKNLLKTAVMLAVLAGLSIYAYQVEHKGANEEKQRKEEAKKLFKAEKEQIQQIRLSKGEESLVVRRDGTEEWKIVKPVETEADKGSINTIAGDLVGLKMTGVVEENQARAADYGLSKPYLVAEFKLKDKIEKYSLKIGDINQFDRSAYIQVSGDNRILRSNANIKESLDKDLFALRQKRLMQFDQEKIKKIELKNFHGDMTLEKIDDSWEFIAPVKTRANKGDISSMLSSLNYLTASSFVAEKSGENKDNYGLNPPYIKVVLYSGQAMAAQVLFLGRQIMEGSEDKYLYFATRGDDFPLTRIPDTIIKNLDTSFDNLRDKYLLDLDSKLVKRLKLKVMGENLEVEKIDGDGDVKWKVVGGPPNQPEVFAETAKIESIINDFKNLEAKEFIDGEESKLAQYGLDDGKNLAEFQDQGKSILSKLFLGNEKGEELRFATNQKRQTAFLVEKAKLFSFPKSIAELLEKKDESDVITKEQPPDK